MNNWRSRNELFKRDFQKDLNKLAFIINQSVRFNNKHKKNYNAGAIVLMSKLKPQVNRGNIRGQQKENFKKQYSRFLNIVLQNARSPLGANVAMRPYEMKAKFNRKGTNAFLNVLAGKPLRAYVPPPPRTYTGGAYFGRAVSQRPRVNTPKINQTVARRNGNYRRANIRRQSYNSGKTNIGRRSYNSRTPTVGSRSYPTSQPKCAFKKLSAWGTPICK